MRNKFENQSPKRSMFVICLAFWLVSGQFSTVLAGEKEAIYLTPLFSFGKAGSQAGEFNHPQAISIDLAGGIYVCDTDNHRIQKFNAQGKFQKEIGGFGWENDQFYQPTDVYARSALDIFIADYQNQRIVRYDRQLNYISAMQANPNWDEKLQFAFPLALSLSSQREIFVLDEENFRVIKFNNQGEPEMWFGDFGREPGQLKRPRQIELDRNERIFISDEAAKAVLVFDYFGNYLTSWGKDLLEQPAGIYWDQEMLLVADPGSRQVIFFDKTGASLNLIGLEKGLLEFPVDAALSKTHFYILDAEQACVHVFKWERKAE